MPSECARRQLHVYSVLSNFQFIRFSSIKFTTVGTVTHALTPTGTFCAVSRETDHLTGRFRV
jgi:hypothetical protein